MSPTATIESACAIAKTPDACELSIVMPCLNEAETIESCVSKALKTIEEHDVRGEVIVADNGSTDGSQELARRLGARIVTSQSRGYGAALMAGIGSARGTYILMGDSDDSYDFGQMPVFLEKLRLGYDLVTGNRFKGGIRPGAMPWKHRWIGNPVLSGLGKLFFGCPVGDFHCGIRAFRRDAYDRLQLETPGMEFASEMVIKATLGGLKVAEVPATLDRDGRSRPPHLRSWRDGWRHLRFMLLFSPRWLFLIPGTILFLLGLIISVWLMSGPRQIGRVEFNIHTLLVAGVAVLLGFQLIVFGVFAKMFAIREGLHPPNALVTRLVRYSTLEVGVVAGALLVLSGLTLLVYATWAWRAVNFGGLDPSVTMRHVIPAVVLLTLGTQLVFSSFFLSIMGLRTRKTDEIN